MNFRITTILVVLLLTSLPGLLLAAEAGPPEEARVEQGVAPAATLHGDIPTLEQITVVGQAEDLLTGSSKLSGDTLQQLPRKNSSLTETITVLPRVQIGEGQRTSENAGEILPPLISISGGRAYENNYTIDGTNINSILAPLTGNNIAESVRDVPSHPQRSFIHQDLIDKVTVYDSNIPARYGSFVGGVVDAETRQPRHEFGGQVSFRTTRDTWTEFHIDPESTDGFYHSTDQGLQPRFKKYDAGLELDLPLNEEMGLLAAYKTIRSDVEIYNIDQWQNNRKVLENFFLKYAWQPETPYVVELNASYTPSEEEFFIDQTRNSNITIDRGGYSFSGQLTGDLQPGVLEISSAYLTNDNSRTAETDHYFWPAETPSKNWGEIYDLPFSAEGGYGDIDSQEESLQFRLDLLSRPLPMQLLTNTINAGLAIDHDRGTYDRKQTTYEHALNRAVTDDTVRCEAGDPSCIDNKVYFRERRVYHAEDESATINSYAAYLDDLIETGPFSFRPGVRLAYDDYMKNSDLSYRFAASWDLLRNGRTVLVGGYNRYYGRPLLTYALREARTPYQIQTRVMKTDGSHELTDWEPGKDEVFLRYTYSGLDTPYSDEWNVGIAQRFFHGTLKINYLERDNKDQFAKELFTADVDGETQRGWQLNNNGSSRYKSVKVSWERQWLNHYLNVNYTYNKQDSSNESYDDLFDEEDLEEEVWYDGELINNSDLPRLEYNREHMLNIIYTGRLPWHCTFTNVTRYLGEYEARNTLSSAEKTARGIPTDLTAYESVTRPDYWLFDWRFDWEKAMYQEQSLVLSLEVNNVFNRTPPAGDSETTYELGRQFWLGMTYNY
ncbi:MAG: TonB-dependent receptor plug domain-containing protein [Desulfuromonadales bacterium]